MPCLTVARSRGPVARVRGSTPASGFFIASSTSADIALVHLVARLKAGGFRLLDTQFVTDHLRTFGAIEVPRRQYHKLLEAALSGEGDFAALDVKRPIAGAQALAQLLPPSLRAR